MSFSGVCGVLAGVIFAVSAIWYVVDVANKRVTVSIATFAIFTIMNTSQLASLIAKHVWHVVPFTSVGLISSLLVCLLALRNRRIYFLTADKVGLAGAAIGLLLWAITKNATANLIVLSLVSLFAFIPLIIKTFKQPELETTLPWRLNLVASTFLLLTVNSVAIAVWVVPLRQFTCSLLINIGLLRRKSPSTY